MARAQKQEFCIKTCPIEETAALEAILNGMSKEGWDLYSIYEGEKESKVIYNVIFCRESPFDINDEYDDIEGCKSVMERMFASPQEPYDICLSLQKKIKDRREKIDEIKKFLDGAKEDERAVLNEEIAKEVDKLNNLKKQLRSLLVPQKMIENLGEERLSISLSEDVYVLNNPNYKDNLLALTIKVRQELTKEIGYIIPKVQFIESSGLDSYSFTINVHGVPVVCARAYPNYIVYFEDELNMEEYPKDSIKDTDLISTKPIVWIKEEETKDFWTKGYSASEFVARYLKYYSIKHVYEIFNYSDMNNYIEIVGDNNPLIIDNILGDFISIGELKHLFCSLIREKISVKDVIYIFEKINDLVDDASRADLLEKLRMGLSRQICWSVSSQNKEISAYEISENVVKLLEENAFEPEENEYVIKIDGGQFEAFIRKIAKLAFEKDIVLIAPQHLRQIVFTLVSQLFMDVPTICYEEIAPEFELKIEGQI